MYTVALYTFSKKPNSTAQPAVAGDAFQCRVADPSGILAPVIELKMPNAGDPTRYNYAYIDVWHRYYYIRDWCYNAGIWTAQLQVDVLASWKTSIGSHSLYILRSASDMNGRIADTTYPVIAGVYRDRRVNIYNPFNTDISSGTFVVGIINNDSGAVGAVSYYQFTNAQFNAFCGYLLGNTSWFGSPSDISVPLAKMLVNPFQYVVSCIWLPMAPGGGTAVTSIPFGWWSAPVSATRMSGSAIMRTTASIAVPKHPLALTRGYYLLTDTYSSYYLVVPPFGAVSLNANDLVDVDNIYLEYRVDPVTGYGTCYVMDDQVAPDMTLDSHIITVLHAQAGVPVKLASTAPDVSGVLQQILPGSASQPIESDASAFSVSVNTDVGKGISAVFNTFRRGDAIMRGEEPPAPITAESISNGIQKFASGIATIALQRMYPMQSVGSNGNFAAGQAYIQLIGTFARIADEDLANRGRPLCEVKTINTLSGFFQVAEADFNIPCTVTELQAISGAAAAGMFWE